MLQYWYHMDVQTMENLVALNVTIAIVQHVKNTLDFSFWCLWLKNEFLEPLLHYRIAINNIVRCLGIHRTVIFKRCKTLHLDWSCILITNGSVIYKKCLGFRLWGITGAWSFQFWSFSLHRSSFSLFCFLKRRLHSFCTPIACNYVNRLRNEPLDFNLRDSVFLWRVMIKITKLI